MIKLTVLLKKTKNGGIMKKLAFNNEKYLLIQREEILKRISSFGNKLYLEFGGKLFDDFHAERVLPGFEHDSKLKMLLGLKDKAEIVIAVNSADIQNNKIREDLGLTYEAEVIRLIEAFNQVGLFVSSVVFTKFHDEPLTVIFKQKLENLGIKTYIHYTIQGYPHNIPLVVSEDGLGKNEYIETTRPLVVVTAPGPGSGKMGTCLSQLYHDHNKGISAGYAKFETFPVWNVPLKHPLNLAYEAATLDLNDVNMIDPFHFEKYGVMAVNYNRDVEVFPLLKAIFEKIYGECSYNSPTDMGVNMLGFCIEDDDVLVEACKQEIIRRYFNAKKHCFFGKYDSKIIDKAAMLMNQADAPVTLRKCVAATNAKAEEKQTSVIGIEMPDGSVVTGKTSNLLRSPASVILNALKKFANLDDDLLLISPNVIEPIHELKTKSLGYRNPRLHLDEMLIALSIAATTNSQAKLALDQLPKLRGLQAHSSAILGDFDLKYLKCLGIQITEEPLLDPSKKHRLVK